MDLVRVRDERAKRFRTLTLAFLALLLIILPPADCSPELSCRSLHFIQGFPVNNIRQQFDSGNYCGQTITITYNGKSGSGHYADRVPIPGSAPGVMCSLRHLTVPRVPVWRA